MVEATSSSVIRSSDPNHVVQERPMATLQELTEVVVASWILGGRQERIPTSHGLLDRALKIAIDKGAFPTWSENLHFVDSRVGLQCAELPSILDWAQRAQLTTAPNPSYRFAQVQVTERAARSMLRDLGVPEEEARKWGNALAQAVDEAKRSLDTFEEAAVEEY